jgi:signal transduction histidine kinase
MSNAAYDFGDPPLEPTRVSPDSQNSACSVAPRHGHGEPGNVIHWSVSDANGQPTNYRLEVPDPPYPRDWLLALNQAVPRSCPGIPDDEVYLGLHAADGRSLMAPIRLADCSQATRLVGLLPSLEWQQDAQGTLYLTETRDIFDGGQVIAHLTRWSAVNPKAILQERDSLIALQELTKQALWRIGHNVRTPLNAVFGLVQMAMLGIMPQGKDLSDWQRTVALSLNQFDATVRDAVQMPSVSDSSEQRVNAVVSDALQVARRMLLPSMDAKSIICVVSSDVGKVTMTKEVLTEILLNVLSNAIKYSPPGVAIRVDVMRNDEFTQIDVINAIDVEREIHFPDLNRSMRNVSVDSGGDGVGLVTSHFLARRSGGDILFERRGAHQCRASIRVPTA